MNEAVNVQRLNTACPHDCPSTCALEVEVDDRGQIGRVYGAPDNDYTAGVICAKVARYADRLNHPDRLLQPRQRTGDKGGGDWRSITWDNALDEVCEQLARVERRYGAESVWPYRYAGTMGLVQQPAIDGLRHVRGWSRQYDTICVKTAWTGWLAGYGKLAGKDPREMAESDVIVIWGTNAVNTQINVMTHAVRARKARGARIVAIDIYQNGTLEQADIGVVVRPGTDGALACALMHCLFRDGYADRQYLAEHADAAAAFERHLASRTPQWAAEITGVPTAQIEQLADLIGQHKRTFFRIGYGLSRQRNGTTNVHAVCAVPMVTGAWQHRGGGALHSNSGVNGLNKTRISALDTVAPATRLLDQSRFGAVLTGEPEALREGPPVHALLIQNTNPANIAPEQEKVLAGLARDDLFTCVHEQFMTDTADMADIVLPATMFLEHDDIYKGGGHMYVIPGPKLLDPPTGPKSNVELIQLIAERLGANYPGRDMTAVDHIGWMLAHTDQMLDWPTLVQQKWQHSPALEKVFATTDVFGWPDRRFRFAPDWQSWPDAEAGLMGPYQSMPEFADHWAVSESTTADYPYRLATSPARSFLNSTFAETAMSAAKEGQGPTVMIHPDDAEHEALEDGDLVRLENERGSILIKAEISSKAPRGTLIAEGLWPNKAHIEGKGINVLTSGDPSAPLGGAPFHDNHVRVLRG